MDKPEVDPPAIAVESTEQPESVGERNFIRPKNRRGPKPEKLTEDLIENICKAIRLGMYIEQAAALGGICRDSFYKWVRQGVRTGNGLEGLLADRVKKALAESEARDLSRLDKAIDGGAWQAAAWKLERKFPDRWGRKLSLEHTGKEGAPIEVTCVPIERLKNIARELLIEPEEN